MECKARGINREIIEKIDPVSIYGLMNVISGESPWLISTGEWNRDGTVFEGDFANLDVVGSSPVCQQLRKIHRFFIIPSTPLSQIR
jgi:hypothetical protein